MKITLSNISFKGGTQELESSKPKRRNYYGKIFEPVDNGDIRTNKRGNVYPTPFEDCFEKMTFEEDIEDNMWRDAQYVDEFERVSHAGDNLTSHIIYEEPFIHKYYSDDDIPLADSVIRRTLNISPYADAQLDFDTDMERPQIMRLKKINYIENIVPQLIPGADYETVNQFASAAAHYETIGQPSSRIIRSIERCRLFNPNERYQEPNIKLFEFLLDNPNYRPLVVQKNHSGKEIFDSTYATYFNNFKKYFANIEDVKFALDLCKTNETGLPLVNRDLCAIIMLLRHRTAQDSNAPKINYSIPIYNASADYKSKKYVDPKTPLTENDIALIQKLKSSNLLANDMHLIAKSFLSENKMTVAATLEIIDKFTTRKEEINSIISKLKENTLDQDKSSISGIEKLLNSEFDDALSNPTAPLSNFGLFDSTKKLIRMNVDAPSIALCLKKLDDISGKIPLTDKFVKEFANLLVEKDENNKNVINKSLADILTKLVLISRNISDIDYEIIALLKENSQDDPKLLNLVNGMLNRVSNKTEVLTAIKEKIIANKKAIKDSNETKNNEITVVTEKDSESPRVTTHTSPSIPKKTNPSANITGITRGQVTQTSTKSDFTVTIQQQPYRREILQNMQLAKISNKLLFTEEPTEFACKIISTITSNDKDKQMWLDFVERLIIKGYSNQRILAAIEDKKRESTQSPKPNETYMDRLMRERLGENVIKSIEERIEKEEASKRLERLARSSEAKTETTPREENNNETYMQRLIRERLGDYKPDNED